MQKVRVFVQGIEIGAVFAGRYRIERVIGRGGLGIVVQATHLQLRQPVAIKMLRPDVFAHHDLELVERFLREAQAGARLRSEHVARVIDVGSFDTGAPYMVLEYLEGWDLAKLPRAALADGSVIDLILQACEALAEAHAAGIVHRDVKPSNLFVARRTDGSLLLKVLDFGISKVSLPAGQLTSTQALLGTPGYMSPEQMRSSRNVDHRSDIWSLGVVLYELLQGARPFEDDELPAMIFKVVGDPVPPLTVPLPGGLAALVYRCLAKDPAERFQSIAELTVALAPYARSEAQAAISLQRTRLIQANTAAERPVAWAGSEAVSTVAGDAPPAAPLRARPVPAAALAPVAVPVVPYSPPAPVVSSGAPAVVQLPVGSHPWAPATTAPAVSHAPMVPRVQVAPASASVPVALPSTMSSASGASAIQQPVARRWPLLATVGVVAGGVAAAIAFAVMAPRGDVRDDASDGRPAGPRVIAPAAPQVPVPDPPAAPAAHPPAAAKPVAAPIAPPATPIAPPAAPIAPSATPIAPPATPTAPSGAPHVDAGVADEATAIAPAAPAPSRGTAPVAAPPRATAPAAAPIPRARPAASSPATPSPAAAPAPRRAVKPSPGASDDDILRRRK